MRERTRCVTIALSNSGSRTPWWARVTGPIVGLLWLVGLIAVPGPRDPLVNALSLLVAAACFGLFAWFHFTLDLRSRYPISVLVGIGLCLLGSGVCLWRENSYGLMIRLSLPLLVLAILVFYIFYFSVYWGSSRKSTLQVCDRFPDFTLSDTEGQWVTRASMLVGGPALMLFYKGDW
jgi:hypothetical protein